jgi:hypothetical protein
VDGSFVLSHSEWSCPTVSNSSLARAAGTCIEQRVLSCKRQSAMGTLDDCMLGHAKFIFPQFCQSVTETLCHLSGRPAYLRKSLCHKGCACSLYRKLPFCHRPHRHEDMQRLDPSGLQHRSRIVNAHRRSGFQREKVSQCNRMRNESLQNDGSKAY